MKHETPPAVFWARRAGLALILTAAAMYTAFFFAPEAEAETVTAAAAFWGMVSTYTTGVALLFTPTK